MSKEIPYEQRYYNRRRPLEDRIEIMALQIEKMEKAVASKQKTIEEMKLRLVELRNKQTNSSI